MQLKTLLILVLLAVVVAAPLVDALACDDCRDIPLRDMQQRLTKGADHSDGNFVSSVADRPAPRETGTAQDLCPVCANIAIAMGNANAGAPSSISHTNHLPVLTAFSDPSYPITKPPQN